ncbi:MAG: hypothetical protein ACYCZM_10155 [Acidimicrobiales bacterium]
MQPTVGAELAGARRSLSALAAGPELPADVEDVIRTLRRAEKVWSQALPYLVADNVRIERLLTRLVPLLSVRAVPDVVAALDAAVATTPESGSAAGLDVEAVNERNELLRGVLSQLVTTEPSGDADADADATVRSMIVDCLRESLDARPW